MAVTKWVNANGGDWNTAGNWDNGVPDSTKDAVIDAASFAANGKVITISAASSCLSLDCSLADQTFSITSAVYGLSIYGHVTLSSNLTYTFTSTAYTYLKATDARNITMNGCTPAFNRLYFDGVGGSWTNQDNMSCGSTEIHQVNGEWKQNGKVITSTGAWITDTGTKVLTMGASTFNIGTWNNAVPTGFTFNYDTSLVNITSASTLTGATTFYNLTHIGAAALSASGRPMTANITVQNILTLTGNNASNFRLLICSNTIGTPRTITCGSLVASNVDFRDITLVQLNGGLDANETDNLIIDLNKSAWGGTGKVLYLKGANAAPTAASAAAITSLQVKGVTVTTN